jgi:hypothetical protein
MGPHSILRRKRSKPAVDDAQLSVPPSPTKTYEDDEDQVLNLEAQGIMVYDRSTGAESHVRQHRRGMEWELTVLDNVDGPSIGASRGYH